MSRPIPKPTNITKPFWEATKQQKLVIQYCKDCGKYTWYPRPVCMKCMSRNLEWREVSGKGKVYSYTITYTAPKGFEDMVPYVVASIDLEEGVRLLSNIVDCKPEEVEVGMEVEVTFEDLNEEMKLPVFRPVK